MSHRLLAPRRRVLAVVVGVVALLLTPLAVGQPAAAGPSGPSGGARSCERHVNDTYAKLLRCVTVDGVLEHMEAFQEIADDNDDPYYPGTRADGTEGYDESVGYVVDKLEDAGYRVTLDPVEFEFNFPATLRQTAPVTAEYETGVFSESGSVTLEGAVIPVDINLVGDRASTSGCEPEDFAAADWSGATDIALIQRGTCTFGTKAHNAQLAGAEAVVIFNQGNTPDREALIVGDASSLQDGTPVSHDIPVVGASFADGSALSVAGTTAFVEVLPSEIRTEPNVIAELPGRNRNNVVMAGAHLDSVIQGPGVNDDGSGSAALLETALALAKIRPQNTMRFGWWAAEELGLVGSTDYVNGLSQTERDRIALYLNYDMIGSPNGIQMVYDADQSTFPPPEGVPIPDGSTAIEDLYESYYTMVGEPYDDAQFSGRSDYQAFIENDIPAGGLFTGAEVTKTAEQVAIWGGTADEQFDPCYHEDCDTFANLDLHYLDVNSDLLAFAQLTFAYSTESVNGVPGRRVPGRPVHLPPPAGPEGTFGSDGGDGPGSETL
jgi:Zn-dependent M28 family amino/carboxypeptidase